MATGKGGKGKGTGKGSGDSSSPLSEQCSLGNCPEAAIGHGQHWDGPLCAGHLKRDADRFRESYYAYRQSTIDEPMRKVSRFVDLTRGALFELTSDRADAADAFDAILERVQQCRQLVIGRLDEKIDTMEGNMRSLHFFEKLKTEINEAETAGNLAKSFQLSKKMQLSLEDAPLSDGWLDPVDCSVELVKRLQNSVQALSLDAEDAECQSMRSRLESAAPSIKCTLLTTGLQFVCLAVCDRTDGFHYSGQSVCKTAQNGFLPLPSVCLLAVGNNGGNWYFAYCNLELAIFSQWNIANNNIVLVSGDCVSHLQQIFLLGNNKSLTVTDLAGTRLRTVDNLQFLSAPSSITHDMEKLYILGDGGISCLSLETLSAANDPEKLKELQEAKPMSLPEDVVNARSVTVSGRNLMLTSATSVHRMSLATKRCVRVWQSGIQGTHWISCIGLGFVSVLDVNGKVTILDSNWRSVKEMDLTKLGANYFKFCQSCNSASYTLQSASVCVASIGDSCRQFFLFSMSCGHRALVSLTLC